MPQEKGSEVLIAGAGVIGLSIARSLHRRGFTRITVIDRSEPGCEASYAAAGMLAPQAEADRADVFFRFCRASNLMYPEFTRDLKEETGVDIEFDDSGTLYLAFTESDLVELSRRWEWQDGAGLRVERLSAEETHRLEPFVSPESLGSLFFPEDRQVENRLVVNALLKYAELNGIKVIPGKEAAEIVVRSGGASGVRLADGIVLEADKVVIAAGAWTSRIKIEGRETAVAKVRPVRGQMISFRTAKRLFSRVIYSPRGYIVPRRLGRVLAGATSEDAGFDNTITEAGIDAVWKNAVEISPGLANLAIDEKWSGLRPFCEGGRPFIGEVPGIGNLYAAVGHYRNGILLAPITGETVADLIAEGKAGEFVESFGRDASVAGVQ